MNVNDLPRLEQDVAVAGSCAMDETGGPACFAIGVIAGVYINEKIH